MKIKVYNPGILPNRPSPKPGEKIEFTVDGIPPIKNINFSLRNINSPEYGKFIKLRKQAIIAMNGRRWYFGQVKLEVICSYPENVFNKKEYIGGICDSLGGSHGFSFTYLPIVYEDDCLIAECHFIFQRSNNKYYTVKITFLD